MKPLATIIIGFIAGLAISGVLGDLIVAVNKAAGRASVAWTVSKAQKAFTAGDYSLAYSRYQKALKNIPPNNKILLAKTKNNAALSLFNLSYDEKNIIGVENAISIFNESLAIYKEIPDLENAKQVETNIAEAQKAVKELEEEASVLSLRAVGCAGAIK